MHKAQSLLRHSDKPLFEIADLVGYRSEAAFSKAFKRETGLAPGSYRKHEFV
jgi:AraC-like DNA-binding protein